jgi:hypothetical protein
MLNLTDRERAGLLATRSHLTHALGALPRRGGPIGLLPVRWGLEALLGDVTELVAEGAGPAEAPTREEIAAERARSYRADEHPKANPLPDERQSVRQLAASFELPGDHAGGDRR